MSFLPRAEVERLTKRTRFAAMRRALDRMGIRYDAPRLTRSGRVDATVAMAGWLAGNSA